jgi:hypothetical protein
MILTRRITALLPKLMPISHFPEMARAQAGMLEQDRAAPRASLRARALLGSFRHPLSPRCSGIVCSPNLSHWCKLNGKPCRPFTENIGFVS